MANVSFIHLFPSNIQGTPLDSSKVLIQIIWSFILIHFDFSVEDEGVVTVVVEDEGVVTVVVEEDVVTVVVEVVVEDETVEDEGVVGG